jgi:signal transduction histidine kinase
MPILQLVFISIALLLGLVVIIRNPRDRNRWLLLVFNISVSFWILTYILADLKLEGDASLFWNRTIFIGALLMAYIGFLMIASLAGKLGKLALFWGIGLFIWSVITLATPFIVQGVMPRLGADGTFAGLDVVRGLGYPLYVVTLVGSGGGLVAYALYLSRHSRGRFKAQLRVIFAGFFFMLLIGLTMGVLLPLLLGNSAPANFSFLAAFAVMAAFTYAIVRQKFFDIRSAIVRSLGYFLTLAIVAVFYAVVVFGAAGVLFGGESQSIAASSYYVAAALAVAITFQPLKRAVERLTRKFFLHDVYDTTEVFDKLTTSLVGAVELKSIVDSAESILNNAVKVDVFEIVWDKKQSKFSGLLGSLVHEKEWPLVTDTLEQHGHLYELLSEANVSMVTRLRTSHEIVGYIVCGRKVRGDVLSNQDVELIKTASGELAVALQNAMRFEEISGFNITLRQEVKQATSELRASNSKLRKLDEAKDEFISMASHQLRTPLTGVKGYISMALEGDAGKLNEGQKKLLEEAFMSSQRMVYLIGDFLNVSRIQTGKFVLELKPINLAIVVQEEINQLMTTALRRQIKLEYHMPQNFPPLTLDEDKMRQVIMNFTDNAIYYSKPNSTVKIELIATATDVQLRVIDTGIGVPEAERHHLFTKFYRAANARQVRPDGTGVGLFMAKKVVTAHGGNIIFETQMGKGSTFGFSMPLKMVHVSEDKAEELKEQPAQDNGATADHSK